MLHWKKLIVVNLFCNDRSDVSDAQKEEVKRILSYLLLLECSHPHLLARLNLLIKLARLMCVFLLGM